MLVAFGDVEVDLARRQLLRAGRPVDLSPKAYVLLELLLKTRPRALSKTEIQEVLWPKTFVADSNLRALINEVRAAIGDDARRPRLVRTVYGFGYSFCGEADQPAVRESGPPSRYVHRLKWGAEQLDLAQGETVLGRDQSAAVWIGDESASRRHARILVSQGSAVVEDLGSKNGTFHGVERLEGSAPLKNGDQIRIGSVRLTYQRISASASTRTRAPSRA